MNQNEQQVDMSWKNYPSKDANSGSPPAAAGTKRSRITRACKYSYFILTTERLTEMVVF